MSLETSQSLRLFIAIAFPAEIKAELESLLERLRKGMQFTGAHPTWVTAENLHITTAFLGSQDPEVLPQIRAAMDATVQGVEPFHLRLNGLELFPTPRDPRVISVGLSSGVPRLVTLHDKLREALREQEISVDTKPLRPHITLARIKSVKGLAGLKGIVKSHAAFSGSEFSVPGITLYQSTLTSKAPVYEMLHSAEFAPPA